jgi:hypothetical protein
MQLTKLHNDFWKIADAFDTETFTSLIQEFKSKDRWNKIPQGSTIRQEGNIKHTNIDAWQQELGNIISKYFSTECYPNTTQLWYDHEDYLNDLHCDLSPNLSANVQIYLCDGDINMGTHCNIDSTWCSVPYIANHGYLMFNPTQYEHGMKTPVIDKRMSLYQSFRTTQQESPIW